MAISKYDNPALQPVRDLTPVTAQLPFEALYNQLQQKQAAHDKGKADVKTTKDGLYAATNSLQVDDPTRIEILNNYTKRIDSAVESLGGDFSNASTVLDPLKSEIVRDVTGGMLGKQQVSLATAQEDAKTYAKEADKIGSTNKAFGDIGFETFNATGGTVLMNNGSYSTYNGAAYKNDVSSESLKLQDDTFNGWMASSYKQDKVNGGWIDRSSNKQVTEQELLPNVQNVVYKDAEFQQQVKRDAVVANKDYHVNANIIKRADDVLTNGVLTSTQRAEVLKNKGIAESQLNLYTNNHKANLIMQMNGGIEANKQAITSRLAKIGSATATEAKKLNAEIVELNNQNKAYAATLENVDKLTADDYAAATDMSYIQNANNARVKLLVDKYSFSETEQLKKANPYAMIAARAKAAEVKPVHDRIIEVDINLELNNKVSISDLEDNKANLAQRRTNAVNQDYINKTFYTENSPNSDRRAEVTNIITKGNKEEMDATYNKLLAANTSGAYTADLNALAAARAEHMQTKELEYTIEKQKTLFKQHVNTPAWKNSVKDYMSTNTGLTGFSTNAVIPTKDGKKVSLSDKMTEYLSEGLSPDEAMVRLKNETGVSSGVQAGGGREFNLYKDSERAVGADTILEEYTKSFNSLIKDAKPLTNDSKVVTFSSANINNVLSIAQGGLQSQAMLKTPEGKDISLADAKIVNQQLTGALDLQGNYIYAVKVQRGTGQKATFETHLVVNSINNADMLFPGVGAASAMENRPKIVKYMGDFSATGFNRLDAVIASNNDQAAYQLIGQPGFKAALSNNGYTMYTPSGAKNVQAKPIEGNANAYRLYIDGKEVSPNMSNKQIARVLGAYMYDYTTPSLNGNASSKQGDISGVGLGDDFVGNEF